MAVATQLEAVAQHEELANRSAGKHHQNQHQPIHVVVVQPAVVVRQHGEQHRQREVGVVHRTLLAALAVDRIHGLARLQVGHDRALAGDDPEEHVGTHRGREHRAHQQERGLAGENMAGQIGRDAHQHQHHRADDGVAVFLLTEDAADRVIQDPEHRQETERRGNRHVRVHRVGAGGIHQIDVGVPQVRDREQGKARQPGRVALPIEPVQMPRQLRRRDRELHGVVETTAVHGPQLARNAIALQVFIDRRRETAVQKDEVEGRTDPCNGGNDVEPAQQQIGPVENVAFHSS